MIYVVEFPHQGKVHAWFAFNREDFLQKVHATRSCEGRVIYDARSARERLAVFGLTPDAADAAKTHAELFGLAQIHGWDTPLYRADCLLGEGILQAEPIDEFNASVAALMQDVKTCRVHLSDAQAMAALQHDPLYDPAEGFYANMVLREQLIAMDAMEEDM